jgi:hypothetical protein
VVHHVRGVQAGAVGPQVHLGGKPLPCCITTMARARGGPAATLGPGHHALPDTPGIMRSPRARSQRQACPWWPGPGQALLPPPGPGHHALPDTPGIMRSPTRPGQGGLEVPVSHVHLFSRSHSRIWRASTRKVSRRRGCGTFGCRAALDAAREQRAQARRDRRTARQAHERASMTADRRARRARELSERLDRAAE